MLLLLSLNTTRKETKMDAFFVSQLARRWNIRPSIISTLFYTRILSDETCPIESGRRLIPASYVPTVEAALRERGLIKAAAEAVAK